MPGRTYALLRRAVLERKQVSCSYHGHVRWMCPHVLGTKNGEPRVLAFQFAGSSLSGLPPGGEWRCMAVDDVANATLHDGAWHSGVGRQQLQHCVDMIDIEAGH